MPVTGISCCGVVGVRRQAFRALRSSARCQWARRSYRQALFRGFTAACRGSLGFADEEAHFGVGGLEGGVDAELFEGLGGGRADGADAAFAEGGEGGVL